MSKVIITGDTHIKYDPLYRGVVERYFDWLSEQDFNKEENTFLSLGDWYDNYHPDPKAVALSIEILQDKLKFKNKYILTGNYKHSFCNIRKTWCEDTLEPIKGVKVFKFIEELKIGNLECLMLPWFNRSVHPEGLSCKQYYEDLPEKYRQKEYDFIFGHLTNRDLFGEIVDISYLTAKKVVLGHVHRSDFSPDFLGTPYITNKAEAGKENRIMVIDNETGEYEYIEVPRFIDYEDVTYPDFPKNTDIPVLILDVYNAPSKEIVKEHYKDYSIRKNGIHKKPVEQGGEGEVVVSDRLSIPQHFNNFCIEKGINEEVSELLVEKVKG